MWEVIQWIAASLGLVAMLVRAWSIMILTRAKYEGKEALEQIATSPKTGALIASATTTTGLGTFLDWIPTDIGKLATLVGILLSIVLIYTHVLSVKKTRLEILILEEKEAERIEAANRRNRRGSD